MVSRVKKQVAHSTLYLWALLLISALFSVVSVLASASFGNLTNTIATLSFENLLISALWIALFFTAQCLLEYAYSTLRGVFSAHASRCLQESCTHQLFAATMPWLRSRGTGDILGSLQIELQGASALLCNVLPDFISQFLRIALFSAVIAFINWQLAVFYFGTIVIVAAIQMPLSRPMQTQNKNVQQKRSAANSMAQEIISQRTAVKSYNAQPKVLEWYGSLLRPWLRASIKSEFVASPLRTFGWICGVLPTFVLCISGAVMVQGGAMTFAAFMTVYFLGDQLTNDCMHIIDVFEQYRKGSASAQKLWEIFDEPTESSAPLLACVPKTNAPVLSFENVNFSYNEQAENYTVRDVSFSIKQGERVALVGGSGCGKSTVLGLALGFLVPKSGVRLMFGQEYENLGLTAVRQNISFVSQTPFMFSDTVKNNVTVSADNLETRQLQELYKKSGMSAFVNSLQNGEDTAIGGAGIYLSTGQQQRVAIARGLAPSVPLLILDEATSALDAQSDSAVFETIANLPKTTSVLAVTHRLSHLQDFDTICVMKSGKIVERGTHAELLALGGAYADLQNVQKEATI